jgi:phage terminase large subunit GpA-like protein
VPRANGDGSKASASGAVGVSTEQLVADWLKLLEPRESQVLSAWVEENFELSPEYSAKTGLVTLYQFQKEPLDTYTDPTVETTVLMCSTQMLKTLFIQACIAYAIAERPGPVLVLRPSDGDAKSFSKERIGPMIRDCARLRGRVFKQKSRDSSNTIQQKTFQGGALTLLGAINPNNVAGRTIRDLHSDEVDKFGKSAGKEGDAIDLGKKRTVNFGSRRFHSLACSPTIAGTSRIGKAYASSDMRKPWVPCPSCGQFQILKFAQVKFDPAGYECLHCSTLWNDVQRWAACEKLEWRAEAPFKGTAGFWISHLYSPWRTIQDIVDEYLEVKDDRQRYITFVNTTLAELWEEEGETPEEDVLMGRRESYPSGDGAIVPKRGLFLTAQVDVQDSPPRLEVEVVAWGRNRENWSIDRRSIEVLAQNKQPLPVTSPELWAELDNYLQREFRHESGNMMPIMVMTIDTGSRPKPVYEFALKHSRLSFGASGPRVVSPRTVVPIKGTDDDLRIISSVSKENAAQKRQGIRIIGIGTHFAKQELYDSLRHTKPREDGGAVPGCHHFPKDYEREYFEGLCSEKRIVRESTGEVVWQKLPNRRRNENLDLKVYGRGAAALMGIDRMTERQWLAYEEALAPITPGGGPPAARETSPGIRPRQILSQDPYL